MPIHFVFWEIGGTIAFFPESYCGWAYYLHLLFSSEAEPSADALKSILKRRQSCFSGYNGRCRHRLFFSPSSTYWEGRKVLYPCRHGLLSVFHSSRHTLSKKRIVSISKKSYIYINNNQVSI